jgi:hypothetical protein
MHWFLKIMPDSRFLKIMPDSRFLRPVAFACE